MTVSLSQILCGRGKRIVTLKLKLLELKQLLKIDEVIMLTL